MPNKFGSDRFNSESALRISVEEMKRDASKQRDRNVKNWLKRSINSHPLGSKK